MSTTPQQQDDASAVWRLVMEELRANQAGTSVPIEAFSEETRLGAGGLGISSLLLLRIFVKLEESFVFTFEDAAVANAKFNTIGDLVSFVREAVRSHRSVAESSP
jgi:acyl carrier protein